MPRFSGRADAAPLLIERLAPYAGQVIFTNVHTKGAVARSLGRLALLTGDRDRAVAWLDQALELHRRLGARYWIARTELELADAWTPGAPWATQSGRPS